MEYGIYLAIVLAVVTVCILKLRELEPTGQESAGSENHTEESAGAASGQQKVRLAHQQVPTPWGWPGSHSTNGHGNHGSAEAAEHGTLHRWVDHLISEKQTVDDREYIRRRETSMRNLLEDRFHSPNYAHNDVSGPTAASPSSAPANRSGNAGSDKRSSTIRHEGRRVDVGTYFDAPLSEVKMPWGW